MTQAIKCIGIEEAAGKTVKAIVQNDCDDCLLIVFADGSLIQFYASAGFDDDDPSIEGQPFFEPGDFGLEVLQEAIGDLHPKIVAEQKTVIEAWNAKAALTIEDAEWAIYEKLRLKFSTRKGFS